MPVFPSRFSAPPVAKGSGPQVSTCPSDSPRLHLDLWLSQLSPLFRPESLPPQLSAGFSCAFAPLLCSACNFGHLLPPLALQPAPVATRQAALPHEAGGGCRAGSCPEPLRENSAYALPPPPSLTISACFFGDGVPHEIQEGGQAGRVRAASRLFSIAPAGKPKGCWRPSRRDATW